MTSALLPGAGQLLAGRRRRGATLAVLSLASIAAAVWFTVQLLSAGSALDLLAWLLRPGVLPAATAVSLLVGVLRALVAFDAWRVAQAPGGSRQARALLVTLALLVAAPHLAVVWVGVRGQQVIDAVSASGDAPAVGTVSTPRRISAADPTTPPADAAAQDGAASPDEVFGDKERLTVLLLGSDAGPGRVGSRMDVQVVASIHLRSGALAIISVARNLAEVPLSDVFAERLGDRFADRLMGLHRAAAADPVLARTFDAPGTAAHRNAVESLLDVTVDHVAEVDMAGFVELVDALGGVEVHVNAPVRVRLSPVHEGEGWRTYDIAAGRRRLDGLQALAYVRSRTGTSDYDRMRRQRCLLGALASQTSALRLLRALPGLTEVLERRVRTDVPADRLSELVRLVGRLDPDALRTLGVRPPLFTSGRNAAGFHRAEVPAIREAVDDLLAAETPPPHATGLSDTCG